MRYSDWEQRQMDIESGEMIDRAAPTPPSAERRERIMELWVTLGGQWDWMRNSPLNAAYVPAAEAKFWSFIAALDHSADARVEAMREAAAQVVEDSITLPALSMYIRALPIKGDE